MSWFSDPDRWWYFSPGVRTAAKNFAFAGVSVATLLAALAAAYHFGFVPRPADKISTLTVPSPFDGEPETTTQKRVTYPPRGPTPARTYRASDSAGVSEVLLPDGTWQRCRPTCVLTYQDFLVQQRRKNGTLPRAQR